VGPT
jgi:hypothetical protein